jgi:hypothetical protein
MNPLCPKCKAELRVGTIMNLRRTHYYYHCYNGCGRYRFGDKRGYASPELLKDTFMACSEYSKQPEKPKPLVVPFCHKCVHGLWAKDLTENNRTLGVQTFMGCSEDSRINNDNVKELCPIIKNFIK